MTAAGSRGAAGLALLAAVWLAGCAAPPVADMPPQLPPTHARPSGVVPATAAGSRGAAPVRAPAATGSTAAPAADEAASTEPADAGAREIARGRATWYGQRHHGRRTASGERFDMHAMTAAHRSLPLGTRVVVRNLRNGREVEVRINDRGPFLRGRIIDLSRAAAAALGLLHDDSATVVLLRP